MNLNDILADRRAFGLKAAKQEAALHFAGMWELERGVGKRLAELSGA